MKPLADQKKHLTEQEKFEKEQIEKNMIFDKDQLKTPPPWLINQIAINEWERIVNEIEKNENSFLCNLDYNNLGAYCNSFAKYQELSKRTGTRFMIGKETNPFISLELKFSDEMRKYASLLGLSIESRAKAGKIKTTKEQDDLNEDFGDI